MYKSMVASLALLCQVSIARGQTASLPDPAAAFGARESVLQLRMSPDGMSVAYIGPIAGAGSALYTLSLAPGATAKLALSSDGKPLRLQGCSWISNSRLTCTVYGAFVDMLLGPYSLNRVVAVNADGGNQKLLSTRQNNYSYGFQFDGGAVIDSSPEQEDAVLMTRNYVPDDHLGTRLGDSKTGLGVDLVDTRHLTVKNVEQPRRDAVEYITDHHGTVRIMGLGQRSGSGYARGVITYEYRLANSREWKKLCEYNELDRTGFKPHSVDRERNVAYGFKKKDGRQALYTIALDGSMQEQLVLARPDVDVEGLMQIGRSSRIVGASFATEHWHTVYTDAPTEATLTALRRAMPGVSLQVVDSSADEKKLLIFASGDSDAGVYYLFDRASRQLNTFVVARNELEGVRLATVKPIRYPAADGTLVPGYLTLPPGHDAKHLPAIVLPHGGPGARDYWGFDWLSQYFAARGYAVLQPNFRGSSGYGDAWFQANGFRSWPTAIGDVLDAGRWLVKQGIADPARLGIVGWSYGGYAALQSAVVDPTVFKSVVAIAPVTDLPGFKEQHRNWSDFEIVNEMIGGGAATHEGSPAEHADKIKVPVLLFHGGMDRNVNIEQSKLMQSRLQAAGVKSDLVTWDNLDHFLEDSGARRQMLTKSDEWLQQSFAR